MESEIIAAVVSGINSQVIIAAMAVAAAVCIAAIAAIAAIVIGYRDVVLAVLRAGARAVSAAGAGLVALTRTAVIAGQKRRSRQTQHLEGSGALSAGGMIGASAAD